VSRQNEGVQLGTAMERVVFSVLLGATVERKTEEAMRIRDDISVIIRW
jgi:hypothetical protein